MWALMGLAHGMNLYSSIFKSKPALTPQLLSLLEDAPDVDLEDQIKARTDLGYVSRPLDTMLKDCHEWLMREKRI